MVLPCVNKQGHFYPSSCAFKTHITITITLKDEKEKFFWEVVHVLRFPRTAQKFNRIFLVLTVLLRYIVKVNGYLIFGLCI